MTPPIYVALLHYPIANKKGEVVTTAVTNMDLHDISRSCRTFGVSGYFVVTPVVDQHILLERILGHWKAAEAKAYNADRAEALSLVRLVNDFGEVRAAIRSECGEEPEVVLTDARAHKRSERYQDYRRELESSERSQPALIVFGTGWGVSEVFFPEVDRVLEPVFGPGDYNHLSVRGAAAIILDRLLGLKQMERRDDSENI